MLTVWTSHLKDPEQKAAFERDIQSAKNVLDRLRTLLKEELDGVVMAENSLRIYDAPNWDYRQAHGNGFRSGLAFVDKITNLDKQKKE